MTAHCASAVWFCVGIVGNLVIGSNPPQSNWKHGACKSWTLLLLLTPQCSQQTFLIWSLFCGIHILSFVYVFGDKIIFSKDTTHTIYKLMLLVFVIPKLHAGMTLLCRGSCVLGSSWLCSSWRAHHFFSNNGITGFKTTDGLGYCPSKHNLKESLAAVK